MGPKRQRLEHVGQAVAQRERLAIEFELAGFDLGEIEDVVDHAQQRFRRAADDIGVFALFGRELRFQQQFRHAQNAVHGRADFVAHVGQELALGRVGLFGRLLLAADGFVRHGQQARLSQEQRVNAQQTNLAVGQRHDDRFVDALDRPAQGDAGRAVNIAVARQL